jgi:hypothetical protein
MYRFYYICGAKDALLKKNTRLIAGLLIDEMDINDLSDIYVEEIMKRTVSYNTYDAVYVGWEGAVIVGPQNSYEHELLIAEIANLQLLQMRIYHNEISRKITDTDAAMHTVFEGKERQKQINLKRLNLSLGEFYDSTRETINTVNDTVFGFGEWYLLRLYSLFDDAFKISNWRKSLEKDLEIIDKRRGIVSDMIRSNRDELLELVIIVLIVIEVLLEVAYLLRYA